MRSLVLASLLLVACSSAPDYPNAASGGGGSSAETGSGGGTGGDGTGGNDTQATTSTTANTTSTSSAGGGGSGGDGGDGGGGQAQTCTSVGCPAAGMDNVFDCSQDCAGACESLVCSTSFQPITAGKYVVYGSHIAEQHPACAEACEEGTRWAMQYRLPAGEHCVAVVGPEGAGWSISEAMGGTPAPACAATQRCGATYEYTNDGMVRWLTIGGGTEADFTGGSVFTIHVLPGACDAQDEGFLAGIEAACNIAGCNGAGG